MWSYLHGGYLIGLAVLAIFAAHAVLVSGRAGLPLAATTILSAALTLLNPAPLELAGAAREDFLSPPRFLSEFLPPDVLTPAGFLFAALVLLVIGTAMLRGGALLEALLLGPLLYLAFVSPPVSAWWRMPGIFVIGCSAGLLHSAIFRAISPIYQHDPAATE